MKKKVLVMLPCIAAVAIAAFVGKKTSGLNAYGSSSLLMQNVEALASDDDGVNNEERLKQVSCTCTNGRSGITLKCRTDGDLEPCTPTQQGSNACYKVGLSGIKLC